MEFFDYLYALWINSYGVFLQKFGMLTLGDVDAIGGRLDGLTVIVTGPTSGIGKDTAEALARKGANVVLACRSPSGGKKVRDKILADALAAGRAPPDVEIQALDLCSLRSVRSFADCWLAEGRPLHVLVNNAGVYALTVPRSETEDGLEIHMASNHLGHFLLTLMLLPCLRRGAAAVPSFGARVVSVSSSMHHLTTGGVSRDDPHLRAAYYSDKAYSQSKLAQLQFTRELRRRLRHEEDESTKAALAAGLPPPATGRVSVFAVHPGMVLTDVVRSLPPVVRRAYQIIMGFLLLTARQGARASVFCSSAPEAPELGNATGGYFDSNCKPVQPSHQATDQANCTWIWNWSASETQLPPEYNLSDPDASLPSATVVDGVEGVKEAGKKLL